MLDTGTSMSSTDSGSGSSDDDESRAQQADAHQQPAPRPGATLLQDGTIQAVAAIAQGMVVVSQWGRTDGGLALRLQPALVLLCIVTMLALMVVWPKGYWRHRSWLLPLGRMLPLIAPSTRSVGVGTALIMERPSQLGALGAVRDFLRAATGARVLPMLAVSAFQLLPPTAALLMHANLTWWTANSPGYCRTQLLADPQSRQRQSQAAAMLDYAALSLSVAQPTAASLAPAGTAAPDAVCAAVVSFMHLSLGVWLPLLMSVYAWRPPPRGARPAGRGLAAHVRGLMLRCDCALYTVLGGDRSRLIRFVISWYAACNLWLLCKVGAGL